MVLGGGLVRREPSANEVSAIKRKDSCPTVTRERATQLSLWPQWTWPQVACFAHSFIDSFNRHSSSIYSLPGTILARKETDTNHCLCPSHGRDTINKRESYRVY